MRKRASLVSALHIWEDFQSPLPPRAEVRRGRTSLGRSVGYGSRNLHFLALKKGGAAAASAALNLLMKMATLVSLARVGVGGEGVAIAMHTRGKSL